MPPQEKAPEPASAASAEKSANNGSNLTMAPVGAYRNASFVYDDEDVHNSTNNNSNSLNNKTAEANNNNNNSEKKTECMEDSFEFDDLLPHIGEFGLYQKILFLLMIPFSFFVAWVYFTQIFITIIPEQHWCFVQELQHLSVEDRIALSIPQTENGLDRCHMYDVNYSEVLSKGILKADESWPIVPCQNGWEYNLTEVPYSSIATEQNWVCENSALPHTAQSIFFCGAILGGLVFGWIADRMGRIPALVGTNVVGFVGGIATAFCTSFWSFCVCRFLVGMAFDNCFTMMYILVLEYVGPKWRTFVANMSIAIFFTFAASILPWIAYYLADWKMLCYVTSAPLALAIFTPWLIPESARWLLSKGKYNKAMGILKKFEKINGTTVSEETYTKFKTSFARSEKDVELNKNYTILDLFKTPRLRKITLLLILMWMAISLVFDGHVRNVGSLGLDVFLTFTIASATEFPADTFLTMVLDVWGRRWLACGSMVVSGIFSLLATAVPLGVPSAALAIMGRFAVNISYNIGLQYAAELLPTVVRAQGVAFIHIMGYVASILAPFVVYLANISVSLPLFILGILGIIGGILALFLPETLDEELPQTLLDGENFGINQKIWDFPCIKKNKSNGCEQGANAFRRTSSIRSSCTRASIRGEIRSSIINRSSIRSQKAGLEKDVV